MIADRLLAAPESESCLTQRNMCWQPCLSHVSRAVKKLEHFQGMTEKLLFQGRARGHVIVILLCLAICSDSLEEHLRAFMGQEK